MRRLIRAYGSAVLCAITLPLACFGQEASPPVARPKIGVALEGGGALGLAHIGVLEWLEAHHIPIDYLAGTSMGGLVGGIYATGMQASELRSVVSSIDWKETLGGRTPYEALAFRRKEDQRAFQNDLEFGLRHGFSLPGGLTAGQNVSFLLDRLSLPYSDLRNFDELPIPFRCVASDLTSGKQHVFEDGPLGEALRATMSLPAIFTPVTSGQNVFADGGLLNNLPVDVVKRMGADIVIAVYLQGPPFRPESKQTIFSIMNRSIGVMIEANELHNLEAADLVISVDLREYSSANYEASTEIIGRGTAGAEKKAQLLARLAVDEATWRQHMMLRESRRKYSIPPPAFIQVSGLSPAASHAIEKKLEPAAGKALDLDKLETDIRVISGTGRFSRFSYRVTQRDGRPGLEIEGEEKDYAPPLVNLGFLVDGFELSNVRFTTTARITALDVGGFRSEWRTEFSLGSTWALSTEYYRPLSAASNWFLAPRAFAKSTPFDLYDHTVQLAQYRIRRYGGGIDLGYGINRFSEIRLGYEIEHFASSLQIGAPVLPSPHGRSGISSVKYTLDHLDSPMVPRTGQIAYFRGGWADAVPGAIKGFPIAEAYTGLVGRVSRRGSVFSQVYGGTTFGYYDTGIPQFFLGGPGFLTAYGKNELRTNEYWLVRLGYIHELFSLPPLIGKKVYFTSAYELAKAYRTSEPSHLATDGSAGLVMETLIGPLLFGGSVGDGGHRRVYFSLGRFF